MGKSCDICKKGQRNEYVKKYKYHIDVFKTQDIEICDDCYKKYAG